MYLTFTYAVPRSDNIAICCGFILSFIASWVCWMFGSATVKLLRNINNKRNYTIM